MNRDRNWCQDSCVGRSWLFIPRPRLMHRMYTVGAMPETSFRGRRAATIENSHLRVTVLVEGGHIAEFFDKQSGVNPLWTTPWPSIEPSTFDPARHTEYGDNAESKLLAGIAGHNVCLDIFGGPSADEAAAGMPVHGEASVARYDAESAGEALVLRTHLAEAQLLFERTIALHGRAARIRETVENLTAADRPVGWTQHVTLGPPFLERGVTQFRVSATRSKVFESEFGSDAYLEPGAEFDWPLAPRNQGGSMDLQILNGASASSAFTTHLMDPAREHAFFAAFAPGSRLAFGYVWKRRDFPWMGIWEENHSRTSPPWNGRTLTRGMEFGVSPIPETRRQMIDRGRLFGVPTYRWIPAKGKVRAEYWAMAQSADAVPETLDWPE